MSMRPAVVPVQRPGDAKLLIVDAFGGLRHAERTSLVDWLHRGDLVVANDAATLPASLHGTHEQTGARIEVRLAGRRSIARDAVDLWTSIVFGDGDYRTRTEERPPPPRLARGDRLAFGSLRASVVEVLDHPRHVALRFEGAAPQIWAGLARDGRPIQYAHIADPIALWDVWTSHAALPVALEPPSAGFILDWQAIVRMQRRGIAFATLTHAAGISSTGDAGLDACLPFDEPYVIPDSTANAVRRAKRGRGRVIAIGTTVVRALEHAARQDGTVVAGAGLATRRIGVGTRLAIVDAIVSGAHEPGTSHYELLRAFADDSTLERTASELGAHDYRTHEFGDSVLIERSRSRARHDGSGRRRDDRTERVRAGRLSHEAFFGEADSTPTRQLS